MAYETPWGYTAQGEPLDATGRVINYGDVISPGAVNPGDAIWRAAPSQPYTPYDPYNPTPTSSRLLPTTTPPGGGGGQPSLSGMGAWEENGQWWYIDASGNIRSLGSSQTQQNQGGISASDQAMINYKLQELAQTGQYNQQQLAMAREKMMADAAYQTNQLAWEKERWGQELAQEQKNYLAQLGANPRSWLEYAAAAGQPPAIQPWMMPLMPQEYGMTAAGQAIPGYSATSMSGMPNLTTPSAQYAARMGPTANAQYQGYQQARTGALPEETQWRMWNMAPPGGGRSLVQTR